METLLELFFSKPHRYESLHREADKITKSAVSFFIKQGDEELALQILEQSWMLYLDWQYFRYGVNFAEQSHENLHESIGAKRRLLKTLDERKYFLRLEREKTDELDKTRLKLKKEIRDFACLLAQTFAKTCRLYGLARLEKELSPTAFD